MDPAVRIPFENLYIVSPKEELEELASSRNSDSDSDSDHTIPDIIPEKLKEIFENGENDSHPQRYLF